MSGAVFGYLFAALPSAPDSTLAEESQFVHALIRVCSSGGETRLISVLFVDVRGFTALAEQLSPGELAAELNRFYNIASQAIFRYDGTLDKLVGDQVMAFFGAPIGREDHVRRAVQAADKILAEVMGVGGSDTLRVGAGISTGTAFVGNVGGGEVTDYTVLGDTVNIAARLQAEARAGEILVSEQTFAEMAASFPNAVRRQLVLKGKSEPVVAWQITADVS